MNLSTYWYNMNILMKAEASVEFDSLHDGTVLCSLNFKPFRITGEGKTAKTAFIRMLRELRDSHYENSLVKRLQIE